ncbi:MAG: hypothetical protein ACM3KR_00755, partial [Deltaproteobacteria bacterium]
MQKIKKVLSLTICLSLIVTSFSFTEIDSKQQDPIKQIQEEVSKKIGDAITQEEIVKPKSVTDEVYQALLNKDTLGADILSNSFSYNSLLENETTRFIVKYRSEEGNSKKSILGKTLSKIKRFKKGNKNSYDLITTKKKMKGKDLLAYLKGMS